MSLLEARRIEHYGLVNWSRNRHGVMEDSLSRVNASTPKAKTGVSNPTDPMMQLSQEHRWQTDRHGVLEGDMVPRPVTPGRTVVVRAREMHTTSGLVFGGDKR